MLKIWSLPKQLIKFNCALKFWLIRFTLPNQYQNSSQGNCVRELKSSEIYKSSKQAKSAAKYAKIAYAWQQNVSISITETCHHWF